MKKALTTIILALATLAASAQQYKEEAQQYKEKAQQYTGSGQMDSLFAALAGIGVQVSKFQSSSKHNWGATIERSVFIDRYTDDWWQAIMSKNKFPSEEVRDSVEADLRGRMARQNPIADKALVIILDALDKVCRSAKESYVVRSRTDGVDSVAYSICLSLFNDSVNNVFTSWSQKQKYYLSAREMAYFQYYFSEEQRVWIGSLRHIVVPTDSIVLASAPFDHKTFAERFDKAMKRKGVRRRPVHWIFDEQYDSPSDPDIDSDVFPVLGHGGVKYVDGQLVTEPGEVRGTVYTVPASDKVLAGAMLEQANEAALTFISQHPEQNHNYWHDLDYMRPLDGAPSMLFGYGNEGKTFIYALRDDYGYHIVHLVSKGAMFLPNSFSRLKKYERGRKTLYK